MKARASLRGLSLQEMLIVVAVFLILALIMVVSSTQVMIRTRVSRVKDEQKTLANACSQYRFENSDLPSILPKLTYPTRFMEKIPDDPFIQDRKTPYTYYTFPNNPNASRRYAILVSAGPDGVVDFQPFGSFTQGQGGAAVEGPPSDDIMDSPQFREWFRNQIVSLSYDPTNGAVSKGDIIKVIDY